MESAKSSSSPQIYTESALDSTLQSSQLAAASVPLPIQINLGSAAYAPRARRRRSSGADVIRLAMLGP